jgi:peroxiredoxin Q/BCP
MAAKKAKKKPAAKKSVKKAAPKKKAAKKVAPKAAKKKPAPKKKAAPKAKAKAKASKPFKKVPILGAQTGAFAPPAAKPAAERKVSSLREGQMAPEFTLVSDNGAPISLREYRGQYVVLYFYPKDDTPGCTQEACDLRDSYGNLRGLKAAVLGVSKDSVASHQKFKAKFGLPFPLLADVDGKVCEAYEVWQPKAMYGKKFMGIERTTFVIDPEGRIKKIFPKVKVQGHVTEIMEAIHQTAPAPAAAVGM